MKIPRPCLAMLLFILASSVHPELWAHPMAVPPDASAEQITLQNFHRAIRGSSAIAGLGDWMLSNGTLCASISDPSHETYLSHRGGALVDLGFCGRNDDQWNTYHELFNLSRDNILPADEIKTEIAPDSAAVIIKGKMGGVENETRYTLNTAHTDELLIETRLSRVEHSLSRKSDAFYLFGALVLHPHRSLTPFVVSTKNPIYSKGFQHPFANTNNKLDMLKVMFPADLHVLVGADHIKPEISYGLQSESIELIEKDGTRRQLRQFAINDQEFTLIGNFTNSLWFDTDGQPGLLQFTQTKFMDLDVGESLLLKKRILVSQRADVASITDQIYSGTTLHGITDNPDNRILVTDQDNHPLTFIKPASDGQFEFVLPAGTATVKLLLNEPNKDASKIVIVNASTDSLITLNSTKSSMATLILPKGKTMHLVFKGNQKTPDPVLFFDTSAFHVGEKRFQTDISSNRISLAGIPADIKKILLPAGNYTVYATHGPEFSLTKKNIHLNANEIQTLSIDEPKRVIKTPGWISADFHVHSEFSFDSTLPAQKRVIDFVAQGSEVLVSTEHKRTINYQPIVEKLGLQHKVVALAGVELTGMAHTDKIPRTMGHSNVFPVVEDGQQFLGGTLPHENRRLGEIIQEYKKQYPNVVFQLNHPRVTLKKDVETDDDINYFNHLSIGKRFDPTLSLDNKQNSSLIEKLAGSEYRDIDFDAMELLNGQDMAAYNLVRQDWFSLLLQGYRKTATADSDSHDAAQVVAMPRNYIHMDSIHIGNDTIESFDKVVLAKAVLRGDVFGTTGPLLEVHLQNVTLHNTGMGEVYSGKQGLLKIAVQKADWIPISKLSVYLNGKIFKELTINRAGNYEVAITANQDSFVTVEVTGNSEGDYAAVFPGIIPFAFSNPIFMDADSDGKWTAPGLH